MIGLRIIGLHVKALLLRGRFRKQKAQALKARIRTNKLFFDAHTAAREGQESSVRPIWQAGRQG